MAGFNCLFPQCSQATLTVSAFNTGSITGSLSNQLVICKTCLAYFSDLTSEECSHTISGPLGIRISIHFLINIFSYLHLFVTNCGYHKMAENNTSDEYNLDENSDSEGYKNEDIGDNESTVPHSDPNSSDIEVLLVGSSEVSSDNTDFGEELGDNGPNTITDATVTANANIPNWTTNFTDITTEPFTQDSGPCLPENFDVSVATAFN